MTIAIENSQVYSTSLVINISSSVVAAAAVEKILPAKMMPLLFRPVFLLFPSGFFF